MWHRVRFFQGCLLSMVPIVVAGELISARWGHLDQVRSWLILLYALGFGVFAYGFMGWGEEALGNQRRSLLLPLPVFSGVVLMGAGASVDFRYPLGYLFWVGLGLFLYGSWITVGVKLRRL